MKGSNIRTVLLTTDTTHHASFVREVGRMFPWERVIVERQSVKPPFDTKHPYEDLMEGYERLELLDGGSASVFDYADAVSVDSVNDSATLELLRKLSPDVVIVFGTGRLREDVIKAAGQLILNLHGGNCEEYRGLDTHLWAIYHRDFKNLMTTLHAVDIGLDTGFIVKQQVLDLEKGCQLHQLRTVNTRVCISLVQNALREMSDHGNVARRKQSKVGRYYSFMPAVIKELCVHKFNQHVSRL